MENYFLQLFLTPFSVVGVPVCVALFVAIYFFDDRPGSYARELIDNAKGDEGRTKVGPGIIKFFFVRLDKNAPPLAKILTLIFKVTYIYTSICLITLVASLVYGALSKAGV